jgi:hypothetical protein
LAGVGTHTQPSAWGLAHISLQPLVLLGLAWLTARLPDTWCELPGWSRFAVLVLGAIDVSGGVVLPFIVQSDVPARFDQLSYIARLNYVGKLRLGQPFLADTLALPGWMLSLGLVGLLGLAIGRVVAVKASPPPV